MHTRPACVPAPEDLLGRKKLKVATTGANHEHLDREHDELFQQ